MELYGTQRRIGREIGNKVASGFMGYHERLQTVDTRINEVSPPYEPPTYGRPAYFERCPGCGGKVILPCVLCQTGGFR